jgi:hypothetical protein
VTEHGIQDGDNLTLSAVDVLRLRQLANNSTRLPNARIVDAGLSDAVIHELVDVLFRLDIRGRDTVVFTTVIDTDDRLDETVIHRDNARCYISLRAARDWEPLATTTIDFLGDPEAGTVTGYSTSELAESADLLSADRWRRR